MNGKGDFLAGMVFGAVLGAVAGLLFAPSPGHETRRRLGERVSEIADETRERATETGGRLKEQVQEKVQGVRERTRGIGRSGDEEAAEDIGS